MTNGLKAFNHEGALFLTALKTGKLSLNKDTIKSINKGYFFYKSCNNTGVIGFPIVFVE